LGYRLLQVAVKQSENLAVASTPLSNQTTSVPLNPRPDNRPVSRIPSYTITPAAVQRDQRVFIQFAGDLTRAEITALNQGLRAAGWRMQGASGERTPNASPLNEVRYAKGNEDAAKDLADALNQSGIVPGKMIKPKRLDKVGSNLEVWISR
jgi:hypothetical protein